MKIRVALVDDHPMFRHALRMMLEKDSRIDVVGEAGDGAEFLQLATKQPIDVVCMDIGMPHMNGVDATRRIKASNPDIKVIALSARTDRDFVLDMLKAGASGYVTKTESGDELLRAILSVRVNRRYLCPEVASSLTGILIDNSEGVASAPRLGARERQVLQLVADGMTSPEIADRLNVATSTVEVHRRNIMRKLDLHSVAGLTKYAIRAGLTSTNV
jgi:two-component system NarL family response regulator